MLEKSTGIDLGKKSEKMTKQLTMKYLWLYGDVGLIFQFPNKSMIIEKVQNLTFDFLCHGHNFF